MSDSTRITGDGTKAEESNTENESTTRAEDQNAKSEEDAKSADSQAASDDEDEQYLMEKGRKALHKEREARREAERVAKERVSEAEQLRARVEELEARQEKAEREAKQAKLAQLRGEVAAELNLPPAAATRLRGATREELIADGKALVEELGIDNRRHYIGDWSQGMRTERHSGGVQAGRERFRERQNKKKD